MNRKIDGVIRSPIEPVVGQRLWGCILLDSKERFNYGDTVHTGTVVSYTPPDIHGVAFVETKRSYYMVIPDVTRDSFPSIGERTYTSGYNPGRP